MLGIRRMFELERYVEGKVYEISFILFFLYMRRFLSFVFFLIKSVSRCRVIFEVLAYKRIVFWGERVEFYIGTGVVKFLFFG